MATYKVDLKYKNTSLSSTGWNIRNGIRIEANSESEAKSKAKEQIQKSLPGKSLTFEFIKITQ